MTVYCEFDVEDDDDNYHGNDDVGGRSSTATAAWQRTRAPSSDYDDNYNRSANVEFPRPGNVTCTVTLSPADK